MLAQQQWTNRLEKALMAYFQIQWVQMIIVVFYVIIEVLLFALLTLLPIKLTYYRLLVDFEGVNSTFQTFAVIIFASHVYLYLNYKLGRLILTTELQRRLLFKDSIVHIKWSKLITIQLIYDLVCLGISLFKRISSDESLWIRLLELMYLAKMYKMVVFHDRIQRYIIGTVFHTIYSVFYGVLILVLLVSYVGCIFYQFDIILNDQNYKFSSLLWINESAWNNIVNDSFGVQLVYAIYWSIGTASACVYGDISASAPPDVVYNIVCLYFEGFLFGFYISRIHSLPANQIEKQNQLLEVFQAFEEHNRDITSKGEFISQQLYFKILCSLQYQEHAKQSLDQIEKIFPADYYRRIKEHMFQEFIDLNPMNLWSSPTLQKQLCTHITEEVTEVGEMLYDYTTVSKSDLIYLKDGRIHAYCELDHGEYFSCYYNNGALVNTFGFVTNLNIKCVQAKLVTYCILYTIKRNSFKKLLTPQNYVYFLSLFNSMISFDNQYLENEPIGIYYEQIAKKSSDVLLMGPARKAEYFNKVINRVDQANTHQRRWYQRLEQRYKKVKNIQRKGRINVGIQCDMHDEILKIDSVFITDQN